MTNPIMRADSAPKPILYVEDEENDVLLVEYGFEKARIRQPLRVVTDGQQALDYLAGTGRFANREEHPLPCLILLDLNLPLLSGMEVLQWVREQAGMRELPVVIFSSSEQPRDKEQARELGASEYLLKPLDLEQFVQMAHQLRARWLDKCAS